MQRIPSSSHSILLLVVVGAVLWSGAGPVASAQQTRTLSIQDGTVYVDGEPLSDEQVPDGLELDGVTAQYHFVGVRRPVVELNGRLFAIGDRLVPVEESEDPQSQTAGTVSETERESASAYEEYLRDVQQSSRELYDRLQRERRLEKNAQSLARVIRTMAEGDERRARVDSLRDLLNRLFELKQENHRRESEHLQRQMQELRRRLQGREEMREEMIESRLEQLVTAGAGQ